MTEQELKVFYSSTVIQTYDEEMQKLTEEYSRKMAKLTIWRNAESKKLFSDYFEAL